MEETFVDWVYDTLTGVLNEEYCLPEVENAFSSGMPCDHMYADVYENYQRICEKYAVDYDNDVEGIINSMFQIARELGYKMYEYGAKYGMQKTLPAEQTVTKRE